MDVQGIHEEAAHFASRNERFVISGPELLLARHIADLLNLSDEHRLRRVVNLALIAFADHLDAMRQCSLSEEPPKEGPKPTVLSVVAEAVDDAYVPAGDGENTCLRCGRTRAEVWEHRMECGCCKGCYSYYQNHVRRGQDSRKRLEETGRMFPPNRMTPKWVTKLERKGWVG